MEIIWYALGFISGGAVVYILCHKTIKEKEQVLDCEIKSYQSATTQVTNFLNYNGTSDGQEDVD